MKKTGAMLVVRALEEPLRQICNNAGVEASVVVDKIKNSGKTGFGYNAARDEYVDMMDAGIVDPTRFRALHSRMLLLSHRSFLPPRHLLPTRRSPHPQHPPLPEWMAAWAACIKGNAQKRPDRKSG